MATVMGSHTRADGPMGTGILTRADAGTPYASGCDDGIDGNFFGADVMFASMSSWTESRTRADAMMA